MSVYQQNAGKICVAVILALASSFVSAQNTLELESTFKGNQEQPTVLYIVPWKAIKAPAAAYQPLENIIKENYALLDRDEFRREVSLRQLLEQQLSSTDQ